MASQKVAAPRSRRKDHPKSARAAAPDILNDVLANGGSIAFHTGQCTRRFIANNKILEHGFWDAEDGAGNSIQIPYRLTAVMSDPLPKPKPRAN
jgi:hypothetical protein